MFSVSCNPFGTSAALGRSALPPQHRLEARGLRSIRLGESVEWVNADSFGHTVTFDDGSFDSGLVPPGQAWTHAFTQAGTYAYHCEPHSARQADGSYGGMVGVIVVAE